MLIIRRNLKAGIKSGISISSESDRELVERMVGNNIIEKPISLDELVLVVSHSHGRVLKCHMSDSIVYFDSTGKYIHDYKVGSSPNFGGGNTEEIQASRKRSSRVATEAYNSAAV